MAKNHQKMTNYCPKTINLVRILENDHFLPFLMIFANFDVFSEKWLIWG
jgi:hypothetical protein